MAADDGHYAAPVVPEGGDGRVQAGIDAFLRCWNLEHAFFVDETNPDDAAVPAVTALRGS